MVQAVGADTATAVALELLRSTTATNGLYTDQTSKVRGYGKCTGSSSVDEYNFNSHVESYLIQYLWAVVQVRL
jgi:hypothetical protein